MTEFNITYHYDGYGIAKVKAKSEDEAKELFYSGDVEYNDIALDGENYEIRVIEKNK